MNDRLRLVVTSVIITSVVGWWLFVKSDSHAKMFCTYGRVFIEFTESGNTWGTMWLDDSGQPVQCGKDEEAKPIRKLINT